MTTDNTTTPDSQAPSKPWYQSTTILASISTGVIALLGIFKIDLTGIDVNQDVLAVATLIGVGVTIWGRVTAKHQITAGSSATPPATLLVLLLIPLFIIGCAAGGGLTPQAQADVTALENYVSEAATFAQELNTGLQTDAPSVEALLTLTHNQGDAQTLASVANSSTLASGAISILQANLAAAIKANQGNAAAQQAAVNQALSPASVSTAVSSVTGTSAQ